MGAQTQFTPDENDHLRDALRRVMARRKWGQKSAATALEITQQNVSAFLNAKSGVSHGTAEKIAELVGQPLDVVLSGSYSDDSQGYKIKALRKALGLTLGEVAHASGFSERELEELEADQRDSGVFSVRLALAHAMGITAKDLGAYLSGQVSLEQIQEHAEQDVDAPAIAQAESTESMARARLKKALGDAFASDAHDIDDVNAVLSALKKLRKFDESIAPDRFLFGMTFTWLNTAASMREQGVHVTLEELFVRVSVRVLRDMWQRSIDASALRGCLVLMMEEYGVTPPDEILPILKRYKSVSDEQERDMVNDLILSLKERVEETKAIPF